MEMRKQVPPFREVNPGTLALAWYINRFLRDPTRKPVRDGQAKPKNDTAYRHEVLQKL